MDLNRSLLHQSQSIFGINFIEVALMQKKISWHSSLLTKGAILFHSVEACFSQLFSHASDVKEFNLGVQCLAREGMVLFFSFSLSEFVVLYSKRRVPRVVFEYCCCLERLSLFRQDADPGLYFIRREYFV